MLQILNRPKKFTCKGMERREELVKKNAFLARGEGVQYREKKAKG